MSLETTFNKIAPAFGTHSLIVLFCFIIKYSLKLMSIKLRLKTHLNDFRLYFNHIMITGYTTVCIKHIHMRGLHIHKTFL